MNKDFRVSIGFLRHKKTKALIKTCGKRGVNCLIALWAYCAEQEPNGELCGYSAAEIEKIVDWKRPKGRFIAACLHNESSFLDTIKEGYRVHNWHKWNGYAATSDIREERARRAAAKRWGAK